jgi:hypothetical protein
LPLALEERIWPTNTPSHYFTLTKIATFSLANMPIGTLTLVPWAMEITNKIHCISNCAAQGAKVII